MGDGRLEVRPIGLPLDCTDAKLEAKLAQLLVQKGNEEGEGARKDGVCTALASVAVEKNALGLCETGKAVALFDGREDEADSVASWLDRELREEERESPERPFLAGVRVQAGARDSVPGDQSAAPSASAKLGLLDLEQHGRNLRELEEDLRNFENNTY